MRFPLVVLALLIAGVVGQVALSAAPDPLASLRPGHPRLLLTDEQLAVNVAAARTDPLRAEFHAFIVRHAESQWREPPLEHVLIGPRLLDQSRAAIGRVLTNAMAFRLTGDARFADFAKRTMLRAAAFPDWNPAHFLDVAEMACALALGYDWLFEQLTIEERRTIKRALIDKALGFAALAYAGADRARLHFVRVHHNWNQVCNGGLLMAALALADEEPELARLVIAGVRTSLPLAMAPYAPDGAYPEGPVYWGYGTRYNVYTLAALESALGTDFDLGKSPGFDRTALYRLHMASANGQSFNYADGLSRLGADDALTWLAQRYDHPYILAANRRWLEQLMREPLDIETVRFVALHAAWFPAAQPAEVPRPPLDARFRGASQLAVFRSAWGDPRALWVGFKAGSNRVNHAHLDLGTFTLDADGVRWAVDLGRDDYNLPGYWERETVESQRWQYLRLNNLGHNTITPGAALQQPTANAPLLRFATSPERAFAIADLSPAYPGAAASMHRGLAMLERAAVLVQDDVTGLRGGTPLTWRMLTETTVRLASDRVATLTKDGRELRVELVAPADGRFTARPATPPTARENPNRGVTMLEAEIPATGDERDVRIAVVLRPVGDRWPLAPAAPMIVPLEEWK